jgi:hypothetical protein
MDDATRAALETMKAYREARDASKPGTSRYAELDKKYKEAEAAYYKIRFEVDGRSGPASSWRYSVLEKKILRMRPTAVRPPRSFWNEVPPGVMPRAARL